MVHLFSESQSQKGPHGPPKSRDGPPKVKMVLGPKGQMGLPEGPNGQMGRVKSVLWDSKKSLFHEKTQKIVISQKGRKSGKKVKKGPRWSFFVF